MESDDCLDGSYAATYISKLVDKIKEASSDFETMSEFKSLKEKCLDPTMSMTACHGLLDIVIEKNIKWQSILADFTVNIPNIRCFPGVLFLINGLMSLRLSETHGNNGYKCPYNLQMPQHPFITILNQAESSWMAVYQEIRNSLESTSDRDIQNSLELYHPVFLFVICNPTRNNLNLFKHKLWDLLLRYQAEHGVNVINQLIGWLPLDCTDHLETNTDLLNVALEFDLADSDPDNLNIWVLWNASLLYKCLQTQVNPMSTIHLLEIAIDSRGESLLCLNPVLFLLARSLAICPSIYLYDLLLLCKLIIQQKHLNPSAMQLLKPSLLCWMTNKSTLVSKAVKVGEEIFRAVESVKYQTRSVTSKLSVKCLDLIHSDSDIYIAVKLSLIMESWRCKENVLIWLDKVESSPFSFTRETLLLVSTLFLDDFNDSRISSKCLSLITSVINQTLFCSHALTLVLYKISNCNNPSRCLSMMEALPRMGGKRETALLTGVIGGLHDGPGHIKAFALRLMHTLWERDERCYPRFEKMLTTTIENRELWREYCITKACILHEICVHKSELHGKDAVAHFSRILSECRDNETAPAAALALDGITVLCRRGVIDAVTTWATIAPTFAKEYRPAVLHSLCSMMGMFPGLSYFEAYPNVQEDVVGKLWAYITDSDDVSIKQSAFKALENFPIEQICSRFPESYVEEIPRENKMPEAMRGDSWLKLLRGSSSSSELLKVVGDFFIKMIAKEISAFGKYIYHTKENKEPLNYSYLPHSSFVRVLGDHIKTNVRQYVLANELDRDVYIECLRILSQEYCKPLPPNNWCFLQELLHDPSTVRLTIALASHQVILSGTARRLMENYITALTETCDKEENVLEVYKNLKSLGNSIQPMIFRPFFEATITQAVKTFAVDNQSQYLKDLIKNMIRTLSDSSIQDSNKAAAAEVMMQVISQLNPSDKLFGELLECISFLPEKYIKQLSSPQSSSGALVQSSILTNDWLRKAVQIRCVIALRATSFPLAHFDELLEFEDVYTVGTYVLESFTPVFQHHKNHKDNASWLLRMMDQIQASMANKHKFEYVLFLCDIFMLAVLVFSGHSALAQTSECHTLLPGAIASLLKVSHWNICIVSAMEWFYHMNINKDIPVSYRRAFGHSLQALRHHVEFKNTMNWMKYLNSEIL